MQEIHEQGLILKHAFSGVYTVAPLRVVEELNVRDQYDYIIVLVRNNHVEEALATIGRNIETLNASFESRGSGYDPFLCAQNVPPALVADDPIVSGSLVAVCVAYQSYAFTVHLTQVEDRWQIANIVCAFE